MVGFAPFIGSIFLFAFTYWEDDKKNTLHFSLLWLHFPDFASAEPEVGGGVQQFFFFFCVRVLWNWASSGWTHCGHVFIQYLKKKEFLIDFLKKWSRSSTLGRRVRGYSILINPFCSWIFYEYFDGNIVHVSFFLCWARNTNQQIDLFQLFFGKKQRNLNEKNWKLRFFFIIDVLLWKNRQRFSVKFRLVCFVWIFSHKKSSSINNMVKHDLTNSWQ